MIRPPEGLISIANRLSAYPSYAGRSPKTPASFRPRSTSFKAAVVASGGEAKEFAATIYIAGCLTATRHVARQRLFVRHPGTTLGGGGFSL